MTAKGRPGIHPVNTGTPGPAPVPSAAMRIRRFTAADAPAVDDICVRTGDAGGDARGRHRTDSLLPDLFARPYWTLEPDFAFVLDDECPDAGSRAVGYVLGTPDTPAFVRAYRERWIPATAARLPVPDRQAAGSPPTPDDELLALHHRPERMLDPGLAGFPAHLHIDLLPAHQGQGHGRALIERIAAEFTAAGASGVHVGVAPGNTAALAFYARVGFVPLGLPGRPTVLGRRLGPPTAGVS